MIKSLLLVIWTIAASGQEHRKIPIDELVDVTHCKFKMARLNIPDPFDPSIPGCSDPGIPGMM